MPLVRTALIATAACLIGAAAYAQTNTDASQSMPQTAPTGNVPAPASSSDMNAGAPTTAPTGAAANTSATVTTNANGDQVIASQPVPDTRANRAQYGQPLSRAGKRTAPIGN